MEFKKLSPKEISQFILSDPKLAYLGFSDSEIAYMYEHNEYSLSPNSYYIGIVENEKLLCIFKWESFTENSLTIHPYISSKYHGDGVTLKKVYEFLYKHFTSQTQIKKVIAFIAEPCIHAVKASEKFGFKKEGFISKCLMWRKELVGMYIYTLELK